MATTARKPRQPQTVEPADLLTIDEAAVYLTVNPRWVRRAIYERGLEHVKLGQHIRLTRSGLDAFIADNTRKLNGHAR